MPGRGRSSFTKRQKEHTRQQKQRDKAVAALNGTDLGGRALKINEAKPKTDAPRGGGAGGGKKFGGGGGGGSRDDYQGHARQPREPRW